LGENKIMKNKLVKPICPECKGTDLDIFPEEAKFGYCYTCKQSVQVYRGTGAETNQMPEDIAKDGSIAVSSTKRIWRCPVCKENFTDLPTEIDRFNHVKLCHDGGENYG
jgi:hypothetical protein